MATTANLFTRIDLDWIDPRGCDRECEVEVDYTFDGETLHIVKTNPIGSVSGIGEWDFDELVWEAVNEVADEAYAEWLADYGD